MDSSKLAADFEAFIKDALDKTEDQFDHFEKLSQDAGANVQIPDVGGPSPKKFDLAPVDNLISEFGSRAPVSNPDTVLESAGKSIDGAFQGLSPEARVDAAKKLMDKIKTLRSIMNEEEINKLIHNSQTLRSLMPSVPALETKLPPAPKPSGSSIPEVQVEGNSGESDSSPSAPISSNLKSDLKDVNMAVAVANAISSEMKDFDSKPSNDGGYKKHERLEQLYMYRLKPMIDLYSKIKANINDPKYAAIKSGLDKFYSTLANNYSEENRQWLYKQYPAFADLMSDLSGVSVTHASFSAEKAFKQAFSEKFIYKIEKNSQEQSLADNPNQKQLLKKLSNLYDAHLLVLGAHPGATLLLSTKELASLISELQHSSLDPQKISDLEGKADRDMAFIGMDL